MFVDADMELSPGLIQECITLTKKKMFPPIVTAYEIAVGYTFWGKAISLEKNCYNSAGWLLAARLFPRRYFLQLGGYDTNLIAGEDWDITVRFQEQGFPFVITEKAFVYHHEANAHLFHMLKKELYYIEQMDKYAKKHPFAFSFQGSLLYRSFIWIRSWKKLLPHPIYTSAFLFYKLMIWILWKLRRNRL